MYCRKCGVENPNSAKFCTECGEKLDVSQSQNQYSNTYQSQSQYPLPPQSQSQYSNSPQSQPQYYQPYQQPYYQQDMYMQQTVANSAANTSLTCGIIGLFIAGFILGIIAVSQSGKAKKAGYIGGKATAGLVLGIIDIIFGSVVTIAILSSWYAY